MYDFLWRALAGGVGVAVVAGPVGCLILWRRLVVFGSALSHSALLGVVLGLVLGIGVTAGAIIVCLAVALIFVLLRRDARVSDDAVLGIVAHAALALGLVLLVFLSDVSTELLSFLFGDILAVAVEDLWWIWGGGGVVLVVLAAIWRPLLAMTVHEELAAVEGVRVDAVRLAFLFAVALVTAVALKIVGALLIISLLIIPAATARRLTRTPEAMAAAAVVVGVVAVAGGLGASLLWDAPASPAIVLVAALLFAASVAAPALSARGAPARR
jgi:zinc transport system permease protein